MYASLEDRQIHSVLTLNAYRVHEAITNRQNTQNWAALYILSSAITAFDYLIGTLWRLPVSIISFPFETLGIKVSLPTLNELLQCALKTLFCAVGILIFPILGIYDPQKAENLLVNLGLIPAQTPEKPLHQSPVLPPIITVENFDPPPVLKRRTTVEIIDEHTKDIIPDEYKNKNLVHIKNENWDRVSKITVSDTSLLPEGDPRRELNVPIFPEQWNTSSKSLPFVLQKAKINKVRLWRHVAKLLGIYSRKKEPVDVMKNIIKTLYSEETKEISPQISPRNDLIPIIDMDKWELLKDIHHEDLENADGTERIIPWKGPVFLRTCLDEWEEMELLLCLEKTLYKGEHLLDVVLKRLNIETPENIDPAKNKKLLICEKVIHTVYPRTHV